MNKRKNLGSLILATLLAGVIAVPAVGYPPGRRLTIALGIDMVVPKTGQAPLLIANARPGTVTIYVGKFPKITVNQAGFTSRILKGYPAGIFDVKVVSPVWYDQPDEIATTKLYVPNVIAPSKGDYTKKTTIKFQYAKPGSVITVTPIKAGKKGRVVIVRVPARSTSTTVTLPARIFGVGTNNGYEVSIGPKIKLKYKFTGLKPATSTSVTNARTFRKTGLTNKPSTDQIDGTPTAAVPKMAVSSNNLMMSTSNSSNPMNLLATK